MGSDPRKYRGGGRRKGKAGKKGVVQPAATLSSGAYWEWSGAVEPSEPTGEFRETVSDATISTKGLGSWGLYHQLLTYWW